MVELTPEEARSSVASPRICSQPASSAPIGSTGPAAPVWICWHASQAGSTTPARAVTPSTKAPVYGPKATTATALTPTTAPGPLPSCPHPAEKEKTSSGRPVPALPCWPATAPNSRGHPPLISSRAGSLFTSPLSALPCALPSRQPCSVLSSLRPSGAASPGSGSPVFRLPSPGFQ